MTRVRVVLLTALAVCLALPALLTATTLERLTMDQLVEKSTQIVRGKATLTGAMQRGSLIYTTYRVDAVETLKGEKAATVDVAVPGGTLGGVKQTIAGAPRMEAGKEYVFFLWTSPKGVKQILGLSQGLFDVQTNASGQLILTRGPADAAMFDAAGRAVEDTGARISLGSLQDRVKKAERQ